MDKTAKSNTQHEQQHARDENAAAMHDYLDYFYAVVM